MPAQHELRGLSIPSSLLVARPPRFPICDENGLSLDLNEHFDPRVDPVVYVRTRDAMMLLRWGEQHAEVITADETIPLWDRQFFVYRGLTMEAARLYHHRSRFKRIDALRGMLVVAGGLMARESSTFESTLAMMARSYAPVVHAVGTAVLTAALYAAVTSETGGSTGPDALASALLAGMAADLGLVNSHRDLLSFDRVMTPPERNILLAHPMSSERILRRLGVEEQEVLDAMLYHHERADGSGYPLGLDHNALPWLAQCVGLADTFLGHITSRPRRPAIEPTEAIATVATGEFTRPVVAALAHLVVSDAAATPPPVPVAS